MNISFLGHKGKQGDQWGAGGLLVDGAPLQSP